MMVTSFCHVYVGLCHVYVGLRVWGKLHFVMYMLVLEYEGKRHFVMYIYVGLRVWRERHFVMYMLVLEYDGNEIFFPKYACLGVWQSMTGLYFVTTVHVFVVEYDRLWRNLQAVMIMLVWEYGRVWGELYFATSMLS